MGEAVKFARLPEGIILGAVLEFIPLMSLATYLLKLLRTLMPKPVAWMSFSPMCVGETLGCQKHSFSGHHKKKRPLYGFLKVGILLIWEAFRDHVDARTLFSVFRLN